MLKMICKVRTLLAEGTRRSSPVDCPRSGGGQGTGVRLVLVVCQYVVMSKETLRFVYFLCDLHRFYLICFDFYLSLRRKTSKKRVIIK